MLDLARWFACSALVVTLALAASGAPVEAQSAAPPLITIHLGATPDDDCAPILYAQKAGLFAAESRPAPTGAYNLRFSDFFAGVRLERNHARLRRQI